MVDTDIKYEQEDEIELMDILLVIWRWKLFITGFIALVVITTLVILFFLKDIYRVSMIIEPIVLEQDIKGKVQYIDTPKNIKALIDSNIINNRIVDKLGNENISTGSLSFVVNIIKPTNKLVVSLDHSSPDKAVDILKSLTLSLNGQYQSKIDIYVEKQKEKIAQVDEQLYLVNTSRINAISDKTDKIDIILKDLFFLELKKKNIETEIEYVKSRIFDVSGKIKDIEQQYETLLGRQKDLLANLSGHTISDTLLIFNSIYNVESRFNSLQNLVYKLEIDKMGKHRKIISTEFNIKKLDSKQRNVEKLFLRKQKELFRKTEAFENSKELIQNKIIKEAILMLNPPAVSSSPVKPKKRRMLLLAFVSGLLISILSVFFLEYFRNYRKRKYESGQS